VPFESMVAVPVVRPEPSRNVVVPLLSVVTVPLIRPLASRRIQAAAAPSPAAPSRSAHMGRSIRKAARLRAIPRSTCRLRWRYRQPRGGR
jgi:hypothetical protein